jgi:hypothetical protein
MNRFQEAAARALDTGIEQAGVLVVVEQEGERKQLTAIKRSETVEVLGDMGVMVEVERFDWTIRQADYIFKGRLARPQRRATIEQEIGGETHVFEMMPVGTDSHCRPTDAQNVGWRIFTQQIKPET